jgi:hypothetical protein
MHNTNTPLNSVRALFVLICCFFLTMSFSVYLTGAFANEDVSASAKYNLTSEIQNSKIDAQRLDFPEHPPGIEGMGI